MTRSYQDIITAANAERASYVQDYPVAFSLGGTVQRSDYLFQSFSRSALFTASQADRNQRMREIHVCAKRIRELAASRDNRREEEYIYSECLSISWQVYREAQAHYTAAEAAAAQERAAQEAARKDFMEKEDARKATEEDAKKTAVNIDIEYGSYNSRRYSRPWGATVEDGKINFRAGSWNGTPSDGGYVRITCQPCSIVATGIKDNRGNGTLVEYYFVRQDGSLGERLSRADALFCSAN